MQTFHGLIPISAKKITRENGFTPSLISLDFDLDGEREALFQGEYLNCYIQITGVSVFELDYLPRHWNYFDTFSPERASIQHNAFVAHLVPAETRFAISADSRFCGNERFELVELGTRIVALPVFACRRLTMRQTGHHHLETSRLTRRITLKRTRFACATY
ncbi:MAG: hypothetical protein LBD79_05710 [Treponema sp.]|nr:hypothetical protein [Treponema sp.]